MSTDDKEVTENAQGESSSRNSKRQRRAKLNWRMDSEESRSDFKIEIAVLRRSVDGKNSEDEATITTYHVHKNVLEFGEKASVYFGALFANQTAESMNNKVRIQLNFVPAAKAFPLLLDYMYGLDEGSPPFSVENAAPLYHIANYFEVESLEHKILDFWEKPMHVDDFAACLQQSEIYHIDFLREIVVKNCAKNLADVAVDSPLFDVTDSKFWFGVFDVYSCDWDPHRNVPYFAVAVSEFCHRQKEKLSAKTFSQLVSRLMKKVLFFVVVPIDSAMKLLEVDNVVMTGTIEGDEEATKRQNFLLDALTRDWKRWVDSTVLHDMVKRISPLQYSRAMAMSFQLAQEENIAQGWMLDNNTHEVHDLTVTGAEIAVVNGVYTTGSRVNEDGNPIFTMDGLWEGEDSTFCLGAFRHRGYGLPDNFRGWVIFVQNEMTNVNLYCALPFTNSRLVDLPRMNGWRKVRGENSQLTLTYDHEVE